MKLLLKITICLTLLFSCKKKSIQVEYYNSCENFSKKIDTVNLENTVLNFRQISDKICYNSYPCLILEFNDNHIEKRLTPFTQGICKYRYRNFLRLTKDSILNNRGYHISKLDSILKVHYLNKKRNYNFSDSPKKAAIEIYLDSSTNGKELKKNLIRITRSFDKVKKQIKDTIHLSVFFNRSIPPPPPPNF